jgi:hypothetical protein
VRTRIQQLHDGQEWELLMTGENDQTPLTELLRVSTAEERVEILGEEFAAFTTEELSLLRGDPFDVAVRKTWARWGPALSRQSERRPFWLIAVEHPPEPCPQPFPPSPMFTTMFASESPMIADQILVEDIRELRCPNCWIVLMRVGAAEGTFLIMPDGRIINPNGAFLVPPTS